MTEEEAREALANWATQYKQRDTLVRQAVAAGVSKNQVHQITGLARTTIDSILGGEIRTHTAVIDAGNVVTVIVSDAAGDRTSLPATPLGTEGGDVQKHAEGFLGCYGWHLAGTWETDGGTLRAPVKRGPRVNDPEIREAIVKGVAQYILRGELHTKRSAHTDAQILARVRHDMADMRGYDYIFPGDGEDARIAAAAKELASWQQDHNVNWDEWAFGH